MEQNRAYVEYENVSITKKSKRTLDNRNELQYDKQALLRNSRGSIAQLGEHLPYKQGVTGSSPVVPTRLWPGSSVG